MIQTNLKQILMGLAVIGSMQDVLAQQNIGEQVQINWQTSSQYDGKDNLNLKLVLKNMSNKPLDLKDWSLWFNSMFPVIERRTDSYQFTNENGNLFKLQFWNQVINSNDSLVFDYETQFPITNVSTVPNGFYFQSKGDLRKSYAVQNVNYASIPPSSPQQRDFYASLYDKNEKLNKLSDYSLVFPTPKSIKVNKGNFIVKGEVLYKADATFVMSDFLLSELKNVLGTSVRVSSGDKSELNIKENKSFGSEAYKLKIDKGGIHIEASTNKGIFYAIQSLKSMNQPNESVYSFPFVEIQDEPRYGYRGFMLDIVRNFNDKKTILKYLDIMAAYKLNVFHFHLIDDEGWRIEIPSLPELTEVGANRSPSYADGNSLHPAYGSGASSTKRLYLTKADFIEILKYANDRFITVIPEIETPGHSRAAIKAMETRYYRLKSQGKNKEAEEYLLHDFDDASVYNSAQNFNDNILNPALPSVYTFINKVLDEFKVMYNTAGVPFKTISLGGDEVPNGVWEKSPKIQQLMKEKGFTSVNQVWPYYIGRINDICLSKGLKLAGWEEIGMVNKGKGMTVNDDMPNKKNMLLDVWNNVIGGGHEDLAYRLANAGYPTVLISSSNMYFDMMWNTNFNEPGLNWATYADLYHSYSLLPEDYFANIDTYYSGKALGKEGFKDRVRLTEEGKRNLVGIKGGLFAETVHSEAKLDYMVFPRFFTLVERAWASKKAYESEANFVSSTFEKDYTQLVNRLGKVDLPKLADRVQFRLPAVGVKEQKGFLYANIEYPNFVIYYTIDGTTPTLQSAKYQPQKGVKITAGNKYVFAVIDADGRVGQLTAID